jgi:hypothetical protein
MAVGEAWRQRMICPHCGVFAQFVDNTRSSVGGETHFISQCVSCSRLVLTVRSGDGETLLDYYPRLVRTVDASVPEAVGAAFVEAQRCFDVGAYNACATMCRRAVQAAVVERGGKGETLFKQIDDLAEQRLITPALQEWAHEVRVIGKVGAHADEPIEATVEDARDGLAFAEELFDHLYVLPARLAKRRTTTTSAGEP